MYERVLEWLWWFTIVHPYPRACSGARSMARTTTVERVHLAVWSWWKREAERRGECVVGPRRLIRLEWD
jgi:hypothetical protein